MDLTKIVSKEMLQRINILSQAADVFCRVLVDIDTDKQGQEQSSVFNYGLRNQIIRSTAEILEIAGYAVCIPYVENRNPGRIRRCTLSDCKCSECKYQEEQNEQNRVFDVIEQALLMSGYMVLKGNYDEIIIRSQKLQNDMTVQIRDKE